MYHQFQKSSSYLRTAIYHAYRQQCVYCGTTFQQRNMHIDHVVPTNMQESRDPDLLKYLDELRDMGFIVDSIAKQIDLQHIAENWEKASYAPAKKKTVYKRYGQFVQLIANGKAASL